jgi:acyl-CoA thioester hydrolase
MDAPFVETTFHVRYAETDAMGLVHHSVYPVWFEEARSEFLRQRGTSYADVEAAGYFFAVTELKARFHAPARYGYAVTVRAWVEESRSRGFTFAYEVKHAETDRQLVTGWTKHLCLDRRGRPCVIPSWLWEAMTGSRES